MKTTVESVDPVTVTLTVEVEPARVSRAFDAAARELATQVSLPGFRPGKAPRKLLEKQLGEGVVAQQAMEESLTEYYAEALEQEELAVVGPPELDLDHFDEEHGCVFEATVEIRPDFDPPEHEGISVTFPEWDITNEDVEAQLEEMRERFAEVDEVDRPADLGDYVTLDLTVTVDGEAVEGGDIEDALYEVGTGGVTPELDEELVGREAGEEFEYDDALPDEYPEHGGEQAHFVVLVKDVREKTVPELDDDFAITASEFDTIDELRKDVRDSLLRRSIMQAQHELRGRIVEAYLANVDIPLPPSMVENEKENRLGQLEQQAEQYGMDVEELLAAEEMTRAEFEDSAEEQARSAVKAQLVLDELANRLDIDVTDDDISQEIVRHAQANGVPPQQIAEIIQEQGSLGALIGDILRRKAIDRIVAAADIDGGPAQDVLIELGLQDDPDADQAEALADLAPSGGEGEVRTESGLIVPGAEPSGGAEGGIVVPGQE